AGAGGEDNDAPFFEVPDGTASDKHFGHLAHLNRRLNPSMNFQLLQGILERQGIDDCAEHAHMICRNAIKSLRAGREASKDIASADNDGDFDTQRMDIPDFAGDSVDDIRIDAKGVR